MRLLFINMLIVANLLFVGAFILFGYVNAGTEHIFFFQVLVLFSTLGVYIVVTRQMKKYGFVFISTVLFLAGSYGPFWDTYLGEGLKSYSHLIEIKRADALAYLSLCYTGMMLGFMFKRKVHRSSTFRFVEIRGSLESFLKFTFWVLFIIWIYLCSLYLDGIMGLFSSSEGRMHNQFSMSIWEQLLAVAARIMTLIMGLFAVLTYERGNKRGLNWRTWLIIIFWFLVCISQYDRGKFFELIFVIFGCKILLSPNLKKLKSTFSVVLIMIVAILLNANGRSYPSTGLLHIVDAFEYGSAKKFERKGEVVTLLPEVGALPMVTTVFDMREKELSLPPSYLLYQVNPLPTFMIPKDLKPDRFFERYLGTFGSSGAPAPIAAVSYMGFGHLGFLVFVLIGVVFNWLSSLPTSTNHQGVKFFYLPGLLIMPMAYGGLMYTLMHGEPRGPIRLCLYAWILSLMLTYLLKSRRIEIRS